MLDIPLFPIAFKRSMAIQRRDLRHSLVGKTQKYSRNNSGIGYALAPIISYLLSITIIADSERMPVKRPIAIYRTICSENEKFHPTMASCIGIIYVHGIFGICVLGMHRSNVYTI